MQVWWKLLILSLVFTPFHCEEICIAEDDTGTITCPEDYFIRVDAAQWSMKGSIWNNIQANWNILVNVNDKSCPFDKKLDIAEYCAGYRSCTLTATKELLGNCPYDMGLKVYYWCSDCKNPENLPSRRRRGIGWDLSFLPRLVGTCNLNLQLPRSDRKCPNILFLTKHTCDDCDDTIIAVQMHAMQTYNARYTKGFDLTRTDNKPPKEELPPLNTVFVRTRSMTYSREGEYCVSNSYAPKYNCEKIMGNEWDCRRQGMVRFTHYVSSGHYEPNKDRFEMEVGRKGGELRKRNAEHDC